MIPRRLFFLLVLGTLLSPTGEITATTPDGVAFHPSSQRTGHTLFSRLDPAVTGLVVDNAYDDPQMWGSRYRSFMGGAMGSGIAVGDFDGDGKVDLFVSTKIRPGRLFRNLGGWKFADVTSAAGVSEDGSMLGWLKSAVGGEAPSVWRQGAVFADVNNDGWPDLFVCRNNAPNLLYINQGNGTFREEAKERGLAIVDGSVVGAFADYDQDGALDVIILTNLLEGTEPSGRPDRLFHNTGDGHFVEVTARSGISGSTFGHAATWFDYNGDRWPDLYICNDFSGADSLYRNNRDGTFTNVLNATIPHTPYSSMGADVADIDNNGHFDLLIADMATTTREKDRRGLAASRDDVLMMGTIEGNAPQYMRSALLLNTGREVFQEAGCWAGVHATDWTWSPRFEDFDNDGWTDLHVTNGMVREANNSDVLARMMRALSDMERISAMKKSPQLDESNLAFRNLQGTGFEPVTQAWGLEDVGVSFGSATADFDSDGDLDLVYLNYNGGLSVFRNDATEGHRMQVRLRGTRSNPQGVGAVVRIEARGGPQARVMTVTRGYASGSELVAHFGLGADTRIERLRVEWPSGVDQEFTNLAADRAYLITEADTAPAPTAAPRPALFRERSAEFGLDVKDASLLAIPDKEQAFIPFRTDRRGPGVAVADVDGDGREDVYLTATTGSPARLLRATERGYVQMPTPGDVPAKVEDGPALLLDVDGNGTRDLLVTKASAYAVGWPETFRAMLYANDGHGGFTPTDWLPGVALNVGAACAADIDGDGDLDLFLGGRSVPGRYPETPRSLLLANDGGRFADISAGSPALGGVGLVKSAVFRDVDGDGRPDLVIALEWDCVRYFHNDGGGRFADWTTRAGFESGGRGWWNGIASADFNDDGRPDFAVGNLGLNTTYQATPSHPATLFYGDFAQNGTRLLSEAVYDGDRLFPLRARADIAARLPNILRRFPKNDDFARATMAEVFGEQNLKAAQVYLADNFASGVFLSQPDGTYRFAPFPRAAQIAPLQGLVATDLDGDGRADVCAVQNTDIATPRFDGGVGVFLRGHPEGRFEVLAPEQSGVIVPGNGRALAVIDPDGDARPDLFLNRHGGRAEILANQASHSRWIEVRLHGPGANPDAVGARVELQFDDGRTQIHQIGLGGDWLTQASSRLFVAVPDGTRLIKAVVTWPDGRRSEHDAPPAQGLWTLPYPTER